MSGRFAPYDEYQDTKLDWLGEVPNHWELRRLGGFFKERREKVSDKDFPALSVTMQGIVPQLEDAAKTKDGDNRKLVRRGDFVINSRSDRKGSSGVSPLDGSVSLIAIVLEPNGMVPAYVHHLLRSEAFQEEFYRFGKGIVADLWSTNYSAMKNITIPVMSDDEQKQIASFLDYETAKIDALIEKQQQLIALLGEKRQAVISHAVTKGLNPDAPMRDSGVEWLGEVPEHWIVSKVKHHFATCSGGTPNTGQREKYYADDQDGVPWIRTTDLNNDLVTSVPIYITDQAVRDSACSLLPEGTVMIALYGGAGTVGKNGLLMFPATINQAVCGILPSIRFESEYVFRYMQFYRPHWMIGAESSRKDPNISQDEVKNAPILCPPHDEQVQIVKHLRMALEKFGTLTEKAEYQVELLQERRTALISAAVTGKIDVRGWKRPSAAPKKETEMEVA